MHRRLLSHFTEHSVISEQQTAYMKENSTVQQLIYMVHMIRTTWANKKIMQGVFLDVSASYHFDKVFLFADDTCMFATGNDPAETSAM